LKNRTYHTYPRIRTNLNCIMKKTTCIYKLSLILQTKSTIYAPNGHCLRNFSPINRRDRKRFQIFISIGVFCLRNIFALAREVILIIL
jgi:hypothetical protein